MANAMCAVATCSLVGILPDDACMILQSFLGAKRRLEVLGRKSDVTVIDDFAHNPEGIKATISETIKLLPQNQKLHVVCAIRGSRGVEINQLNVDALVESVNDDIELYLSSSEDVVNDLNFVEQEEREVFFNTLNQNDICPKKTFFLGCFVA